LTELPESAARCQGCGFAWYGETAVDGLRALGSCIRCGGAIAFADHPPRPARLDPICPGMGPHQVMGPPRLPF
jgi:hypothetical protein